VLVTVILAVGVSAAPKDEPKKKGLLAPLEVGQQVGLKEVSGMFTISVMADVPLGQKVIEVGADYLVVEDPTGTTQTRIPVTAIRSITVTKLPRDK